MIFLKFKSKGFNKIKNQYFNLISTFILYKTPLFLAIEKANLEITKLLLVNDKLDINALYISYK